MTALIDAIPSECWVILFVSFAALILLVGLRLFQKGFEVVWKGGKFECEIEKALPIPEPVEVPDKQELA